MAYWQGHGAAREAKGMRKCGSNESLACKTPLRSPGVCSRHSGELAAVMGGKRVSFPPLTVQGSIDARNSLPSDRFRC